jgi:hypothetical protein
MTGNDKPLTDAEREKLRLIIGDAPDNVARARDWCEQHGAEISFSDHRYTCRRGAEVLATALDLAVLLGKLERLAES